MGTNMLKAPKPTTDIRIYVNRLRICLQHAHSPPFLSKRVIARRSGPKKYWPASHKNPAIAGDKKLPVAAHSNRHQCSTISSVSNAQESPNLLCMGLFGDFVG